MKIRAKMFVTDRHFVFNFYNGREYIQKASLFCVYERQEIVPNSCEGHSNHKRELKIMKRYNKLWKY